jgi:tetratricopeptide (TPR) repeat protein
VFQSAGIAGVGFVFLWATAGCSPPRQTPPPARDSAVADIVAQARKLDLAGQPEAAVARYQEALALDPTSYNAQYGIARALDLVGRYDDARAHFQQALEVASEADKDQTLRMIGIAWVFVGNLKNATEYFRQVFERRLAEPNFATAAEQANEIGRVHLELGDLAGAEMWYRTGHDVAARSPNRPQWQIDLADMRWAHARARLAARRGLAQEALGQAALVKRLLDRGGNDDQKTQYAYVQGYIDCYRGD